MLKRTFTSIVYSGLLLFSIFYGNPVFIWLMTFFCALCLYEYLNLCSKNKWIVCPKLSLVVLLIPLVINLLIYWEHFHYEHYVFVYFLILFFMLLGLFNKNFISTGLSILAIIYILLPFWLLMNLSILKGGSYNSFYPFLIFSSIWVSDSCSYLVGRKLGKRKLFESISPKKTVEGFVGGLIGVVVFMFILSQYFELDIVKMFFLAIIVHCFSVAGDLFESMIKRQVGVKDSGNLLPGHGGLLDRLDSFLLVSPVACIYIIYFL